MIDAVLKRFVQMMRNLDAMIDKAVKHAEAEGIEHETLLHARLAPDMFDFTRQIQSVSDNVKGVAARLAGREVPSFPDDEQSFEALQARLRRTIEFVEGLDASAFEGWAERRITLPFSKSHWAPGADYLHHFGLPNLYFHAVTAYAILRSQGVEIGKRDYIGHMTMNEV